MPLSVVALAALLSGVCAVGQNAEPKQQSQQTGQTQPRQDSRDTSPQKGGSTQSPPAAEKFPYPGESQPAPDASTGKARAPETGTPPAGSATGNPFPYPGDPDGGESSSSSSSSSGSATPTENGDIPADAERPGRRKLPREFHPQSPEDRATEDLDVARFYRDKGDLQAAYLRAQDAVKTLPNDPEGHFLLAQIAQQTKRRDEALAEFKNYLRLEPDGDHVKEARRRLAEIARQ